MKQFFIPGQGFLFREGGQPLAALATKCHELGVLSDEEFADEGGVPALRRYIYAITRQNLRFAVRGRSVTERTRMLQRLTREANAYAEENQVNDPKYLRGDVDIEDLKRFDVPLTGKNLIDAELLSTLYHLHPGKRANKAGMNETSLKILDMLQWIHQGRPER